MPIRRPGPAVISLVLRISFSLLPLAFAKPLTAQAAAPVSDAEPEPSWVVGATYLDIDPDGDPAAAIEVAAVSAFGSFRQAGWMTGLMLSERGEAYLYAGVHLPVSLPGGVTARPSLAIGYYEAGQGLELGSPVEFRSALAVDWPLVPTVAISLFLYHLSNAGLGSHNPGVEALGIGLALTP